MIRRAPRTTRFRLFAGITAAAMTTGAANAAVSPVEVTEIFTATGDINDYFGGAVAIDGDYAIIGSDLDDDLGLNTGAAFIYRRNANGDWVQQIKLLPQEAITLGWYGYKVAISGDTAIVSSYAGKLNNINSGIVYVYHRDNLGFWSQQAVLAPNDAVNWLKFGIDVAIDGDNIIVSARSATLPQAAYIFSRDANDVWTQRERFEADNLFPNGSYGTSVDINGDTAIVGATRDGENMDGAVYVYRYQGNMPFGGDYWLPETKLAPENTTTNAYFGADVSVDDAAGVIVVGAFGHSFGVDLEDAGAAYFYERTGFGAWTNTSFVVPLDPDERDFFGYSVKVRDNVALISATEPFVDAGSVYVFTQDSFGDWTQQSKLVADDATLDDRFGFSVSFDDDHAIVGAPQTDNTASAAGSSYIFLLDPCPADFNGDAVVDTADLGALIAAIPTDDPNIDINGDGVVDTADLGLLIANFGACP